MSIFARSRKKTAAQATKAALLMRFATLGGAVVEVTHYRTASGADRYYERCRGCGWSHDDIDERCARNSANAHAGECRAMPAPEVAQ